MAGNIVKWWRQFKQYKQFSVLQECQTDSEELIYQAPYQTPCSAPPNPKLLKNQNKTVNSQVPVDEPNSHIKPSKTTKGKDYASKEKLSQESKEKLQKRHSIATTRHLEALEENRVQLDEFTCDASLEDANNRKSQPPIQFTFTLYDLDGCGKITKDDIAGIVSTIYENIGNTVVVPHYGKKTINVKLTVSPDAKNQQQTSTTEQIHHSRASKTLQLAPRRRYRPRALLSDDDDDEDGSESTSDNLTSLLKMQNEMTPCTKKTCEALNVDKNNVYESINNLKCSNQSHTIENLLSTKNNRNIEIFKNCQPKQIKENDEFEDRHIKHSSKKKLLRKSKSRRQRPSEARVRSLSVGNNHKWRKHQEEEINQETIKDTCQLNKSTNLRRNELIEIIKDSLEKNCFQAKKKTDNVSGVNQARQRSNTVTCTNKMAVGKSLCPDLDQQHLCAFDSFLHATICSNAHMTLPSDPTKINSAKMNNRNKMKQMNQSMPPALKLKTSVLNQLNPNLTSEQKLTRKLNDVEKWLLERESTTHSYKNDNEGKERLREDKNILNPIMVDKLTTLTPKQVFNKEVLIAKKLKPLGHQSKHQKEILNSSKNQVMLEYSNVPVPGEISECENLLASDEDQAPTEILVDKTAEEKPEAATASSDSSSSHVVRNVIVHHIHHFYHFNENE